MLDVDDVHKGATPHHVAFFHNFMPVFNYDGSPHAYCDIKFAEGLIGKHGESDCIPDEDGRELYCTTWDSIGDGRGYIKHMCILSEAVNGVHEAYRVLAGYGNLYGEFDSSGYEVDTEKPNEDLPGGYIVGTRHFYHSLPRLIWYIKHDMIDMIKEWSDADMDSYIIGANAAKRASEAVCK